MLGPYSTGFLYISDKFIDGVPLEETWIGRKNSQDFSKLTDYQSLYNSDSIRFDMGQRANFSLLPGVKAALEQLHDWSIRKIENTLYQNNLIICKGLSELGFEILSEKNRAPHFISARLPGYDGNLFINILKKNKIFISERSGFLRITPHLWNNEEDFFKLINCLKSIIY
jgi:selenocysteine lyase/cysteine desulfurase